jgi:hypothetical protein
LVALVRALDSVLRTRGAFIPVAVLVLVSIASNVRVSSLGNTTSATARATEVPLNENATRTRSSTQRAFEQLPIPFQPNCGQANSEAKFLAQAAWGWVWLTAAGGTFSFPQSQEITSPADGHSWENGRRRVAPGVSSRAWFRMDVLGARRDIEPVGERLLPGKSNYFIGNAAGKWRVNIPHYREVRYPDVYPGIDLVFYGDGSRVEYDFRLQPGAEPERIRLSFDGVDRMQVDAEGDLVLAIGEMEVKHKRPRIYQEMEGRRVNVGGAYVILEDGVAAFAVKQYERKRPLVIDPMLVFSTYLGGSGSDGGEGIAVDELGNIYVAGNTNSRDFPVTPNAFQTELRSVLSASNVFVTKIDASGAFLVYSTYLGGTGYLGSGDLARRVAVDGEGSAHVVGSTPSIDFPTRAAFQPRYGGGRYDGFITKLSKDGAAIVYSTFLGGRDGDGAWGVSVDGDGNAYVAGATGSTNFPTFKAIQPTFGGSTNCRPFAGCNDAFVAKFAADGTVIYSTYLGGNASDEGLDVATDESGNAYVTGATRSSNFPTTPDALQPHLAEGDCPITRDLCGDVFLTVLSSSGSAFVYSTFLGGERSDRAWSIARDASGDIYLTGDTESPDFPTLKALQSRFGGGVADAFVVKLNLGRSELVYSTYLGGSGADGASAIAVDAFGSAYVTGSTSSADFPTLDSLSTFRPGCSNIFVAKLDPSGSSLSYSTYLGPPDPAADDSEHLGGTFCAGQTGGGLQLAVDGYENAYVTGFTTASDFPTLDALQPERAGGSDAFVTKIASTPGR